MKKMAAVMFILMMLMIPHPAAGQSEHATHILISFDGMRHDLLETYMKAGELPHFGKVAKKGVYAENIQTVYPSLTSAAHAAIATGSNPAQTGMVSNHIHEPGTPLTFHKSAFFSPLDADPIWSEAKKQGKTTATILFPGSNPDRKNRATYSIYYGEIWTQSALESVTFHRSSYSGISGSRPPMETAFAIPIGKKHKANIHILAVASPESGRYDTFHFSPDRNFRKAKGIRKGEWGSVSFPLPNGETAGFSFKLKAVKPDGSSVTFYRTPVTSGVISGPPGFKEDIIERFGFFPVQDDDKALEKKWITRKEYEEISRRFAQWTTDVALYVKKRVRPDLLVLYYPQIDHESHKYLLADPRQPGYSLKKSKQYMGYVRWSYRLADDMLARVLDSMEEADRLFLVSDHGMEPVHSELSPNDTLERAGLLVKDDAGKIDVKKSKAYALASGSIAHVYVNLEGREKGGIVTPEDEEKIRRRIAHLFEKETVKQKPIPFGHAFLFAAAKWRYHMICESMNMKGAATAVGNALAAGAQKNVRPYEAIVINGRGKDKELKHERAGDVLLWAAKGYYMSQDDGAKMDDAGDLGNHGGDPSRYELRPVFMAMGHGIRRGMVERNVSVLDIAPTLYESMGLKTPEFAKGEPIREAMAKRQDKKIP